MSARTVYVISTQVNALNNNLTVMQRSGDLYYFIKTSDRNMVTLTMTPTLTLTNPDPNHDPDPKPNPDPKSNPKPN